MQKDTHPVSLSRAGDGAEEDGRPTHRSWALWRRDDNGNRFLVSVKETKEEVQRLQDAYEKRGHKQYYFIEPY